MKKTFVLVGGVSFILAVAALFEFSTHIGRGWWRGETFYQHRPASWWSVELKHWRYHPFT